jgi:hypothetical protein
MVMQFKAYSRIEHSCSISTRWPTYKTDLDGNSRNYTLFAAMELVQSRHLVWVMSRQVAKTRLTFPSCRGNVTDDNRSGQRTPRRRSQHYTCRGTHSDGQTFILLCMVLNIGLSYGNVQRFMVDVLACLKACPRLVPSALPDDNKAASMRASLSPATLRSRGNRSLRRVVIGYKTRIHDLTPTSKQSIMQWQNSGSPRKKTFKVTTSSGKELTTVFWVCCSWASWRTDAQLTPSCTAIGWSLRQVTRSKHPDLLANGVVILITMPDCTQHSRLGTCCKMPSPTEPGFRTQRFSFFPPWSNPCRNNVSPATKT